MEKRKQAHGQIANENCLTSNTFSQMTCCECLCFQHVPHCDSEQKTAFAETKCGKVSLAMLAGLTALSHLLASPHRVPAEVLVR
jgi:hypothetical protein